MELVLTKKDDLRRVLREEIDGAFERGLQRGDGPARKEWLSNREALDLLGLSKASLQRYRKSGLLPYSKLGGNIFYRYDDLVRVLERHAVRA